MFKCCDFINANFTTIDLSIYDNEKTLIYLDPPYAFECNTFYKVSDEDTLYKNFWERLVHLFKKENYNCLLIHSHNVLVDYILKEYAYQEYDIKYGNTGNIRKHIVYLKNI
jgi:site-specific DNA-adenine methylase